ncbi:MAG: hypothetical protein MJA31_10495 [Clostridia bacterium]|nr:hypothetical protein [Clostridia bacterium]
MIGVKPTNNVTITGIKVNQKTYSNIPEENLSNLKLINTQTSIDIDNNIAIVNVAFTVINLDEVILENIKVDGRIKFFDGLSYRFINVDYPDINVTLLAGHILYSGNIEKLMPNEEVTVILTFSIEGAASPGIYDINNVTRVSDSQGNQDVSGQTPSLKIVELEAKGKFKYNAFETIIKSQSLSPKLKVDVKSFIKIAEGVTIQFSSFGPFTARFVDSSETVPLNIPVKGGQSIQLVSKSITVPTSSSSVLPVFFEVLSSSVFGKTFIEGEIDSITAPESEQVILLPLLKKSERTAFLSVRLGIQ